MNATDAMNVTDAEPLGAGGIAWSTSKVLLFIFQLLIMLETIFGNLLVVMSVKMEKKLQTPFNYYIVNLAITDMNVGMSVMSLFAIYNLYDYFPFNNFVCGYWVWSDYTMTFESVFTLMTISIDRFWSVTWSTHYRNTYSTRKCLLLLSLTWCVVNTIWLPAFIYDRVVNDYAPGECYWDPLRNRYLVLYVGCLGYYMPFLTMIGAYSRILVVMRKRARKIRDSKRVPVQVATVQVSSVAGGEADEKKVVTLADDKEEQRRKREQKAVMTLLSIIGVFAVCWVPFYLLFVISAWYPDFFPGWFVDFSYWMAYINSAVNPVLYFISSAEFRAAYIKIFYIITCRVPPSS